jgi:hypothetical protein
MFDEGSCVRVEFHSCRMSGLQAAGAKFQDVAFVDCRLDGANFRMSRWERSEFDGCDLTEVDLYGAHLPACRFVRCDLSGAQSRRPTCRRVGSISRSWNESVGADALGGITISSDQVLPVALALFAARAIVIDDDSA